MVRCLSTLTRLKELTIEFKFKYPLSRTVQRPHPPTRSALPALTSFQFEGASKYLGGPVTWIDAPLLDTLDITFCHQPIFDTPQLAKFVARTPNIRPPIKAHIDFSDWYVKVKSASAARTFPEQFAFKLGIRHRQSDWRPGLPSLAQVCGSSFREAFISTM